MQTIALVENEVVKQIIFNNKVTITDVNNEFLTSVSKIIFNCNKLMPIQVLKFLELLPYIQDNCQIIFTNVINTNYNRNGFICSDTTLLLFSNIIGNKNVNNKNNIGIVLLDKAKTLENIDTIFLLLLLNWNIKLSDEVVKNYIGILEKNYDVDMLNIFNMAVEINNNMFGEK